MVKTETGSNARTEMLRKLDAASSALAAVQPEHSIYQSLARILVGSFGLSMAWIALAEGRESGDLRIVSVEGDDAGALDAVRVALNGSPAESDALRKVLGAGSHAVVALDKSTAADASWMSAAYGQGFRSLMAISLTSSDATVMALVVLFSRDAAFFSGDMISALLILSRQSAAAVEARRIGSGIEERLRDRTRNLEDALNAAEAAKRAQADFLASMSHELRNPLNAIIGFSEMMIDGLAGPMDRKHVRYLTDVLESGRRLLATINDILDLSRIEAGAMQLEVTEFMPGALMEHCLSLFREKAFTHGIQLDMEVEAGLPALSADERKIRYVVFNLLSNAVKYTPDGGRVRMSAHALPGAVEVSVEDSGIGMSEEDVMRIFDDGHRTDTAHLTKFASNELRLSLCRRFVELHGGSLRVESTRGRGSRFIIILPLTPPMPNEPGTRG